MSLTELQIDRLVGPTHHFGGLGVGNLASHASAGLQSNPAAAAIQGLDKMRLVAELGVPQLILPPQRRPDIDFLRSLGFAGTDSDVLGAAWEQSPELLSAAASCSAMWTANAATVTPAIDSGRAKTNLTIANLNASLHRAIEPEQTEREFRQLIGTACQLHQPLPGGAAMRDEGAANHMRLGSCRNEAGINLFVYGDSDPRPEINWPRQTRAASEAVARLHGLSSENTFFLKQHPAAIDAGAFHNDVVAISHHDLLIHHQLAFQSESATFQAIHDRFRQLTAGPLRRIEISSQELSIDDAVSTYLFNSQVVSKPSADRPVIICAAQVAKHDAAKAIVDGWQADGIFSEVHFVELGQSMSGGGGPACLRLRIPIAAESVQAFGGCQWTEEVDGRLREWFDREYPQALTISDLAAADYRQHAIAVVSQIERLLGAGGAA